MSEVNGDHQDVGKGKKTKGLLTAADLLKKQVLAIEKVELSEGHVFVRELYGAERDAFEQSLLTDEFDADGMPVRRANSENYRAKLAISVICDENRTPLLTPDDAEALGEAMGMRDLEKIINVAQKLNRISDEDRKRLEKKSGKTGK